MRTFKLNIAIPVWNKVYCDLFLNHCLKGLVAQGNLWELDCAVKFIFYTTPADFTYLMSNAYMQRIAKQCEIKMVDMPFQHVAVRHALSQANKDKSILKIISPDVVISEGSLSFAMNKIKEGMKAVIVPTGALRVDQESFPQTYGHDAEELIILFKEYMHQETKRHFVDSEFFFDYPVQKLNYQNSQIKVNSYFYQPWLLDCEDLIWVYENIERDIITEENGVYIVKDSSEIFELSLSPQDKHEPGRNIYGEHKLVKYGIGPLNEKIYEQGYVIA